MVNRPRLTFLRMVRTVDLARRNVEIHLEYERRWTAHRESEVNSNAKMQQGLALPLTNSQEKLGLVRVALPHN